VTIRVSGALAALAADRVASLPNWAFCIVHTAKTDISCWIAISSARRTRQGDAGRNAGVRYVGQADFAHAAAKGSTASRGYITLDAAVQGEVTLRVSKVEAIGVAHARNARPYRRIRQRAMQAESSAVALLVALAERDTLLVTASRVPRRVSRSIRVNRPVGAWGHTGVNSGARVAVSEVHDQRVAAAEARHGHE
jgi:hypothetical protein